MTFKRSRSQVPSSWNLALHGRGGEIAPHRLAETIDDLTAAQTDFTGELQAVADAREAIRECDAKMIRYQAAIDAGADITEVTKWINATKANRIQAEAALRSRSATPARMTKEQITAIIDHFASLAAVIRRADPADKADKAEIYKGMNLMLTYQPGARTIRAEVVIGGDHNGVMVGVRGGT